VLCGNKVTVKRFLSLFNVKDLTVNI